MLKASQILVRSLSLAACAASLAACGQKGPLFLPNAPAASARATLPQVLGISSPASPEGGNAPTAAPGRSPQGDPEGSQELRAE
ncbi:LPS translocon maturation chaperone LptM [Delftia sp. PS-11]|uniref:LPS translocon maturation chaperone LptM n=1 Tax=Delftia sp. PS-11 TaxID=2767222 RepID=UPI0024543FE9|nr:lipoprotein [Delftia sp. PS-11]KAJ8746795.1 lipoprotein [Delftia sp. PS-11]